MPRRLTALVLIAIGLSGLTPAFADGGDELIEAAQQGDQARVLELIEDGVDVDSKSRYGATALFFAADKGNVELIRALLEKGAEVNVTDTFYSASPLTWALSKTSDSQPHREIVLELLAAGAENGGVALGFAAKEGDLEMAKAAVEAGHVEAGEMRAALSAAEAAAHTELVAYLKEKTPAEDASAAVVVAREVLEGFVGDFKNEQLGLDAKIFLVEDELKLQATGQQALTLDSTGDSSFTAREFAGIDLTFAGRGGLTEGFTLQQGGQSFYFPRFEAEAEAIAEAPVAAPLPKPTRQAARPWPAFRGPATSGNGDGQGAPSSWDGESGQNVRWKTPIPGIALSSPIVWGDRVFVTTAISGAEDSTFRTGLYGDVDSVADDSEHTWMVYALDKTSGEIVWQRTAAVGVPKVRRHLKSSHANPTPVTDGHRLVVHFGSEGLFAYSFDGELMWKKDLGVLSSGWFYDSSYEWGFSSSPILHNGTVIVQTDIQKGSFIAAYDISTGRERWRTARDEIPTWGTPNLLPAADGKTEIVTNGPTIRGYDADSGEELWTLGPNSEVTVGSVVVDQQLAIVTGGYPPARPIYAIRPGGRGDLSLGEEKTSSDHIAWSLERGGTYIPTPILYDGHLYMLHNDGRLSAHDVATGEQLYRERVGGAGGSFSGSPVAADGKLYFTSEEGITFVVRSGPIYHELGKNELGEIVMTTPAISDGVMILRGIHHVYALGEPSPSTTEAAPSSVER